MIEKQSFKLIDVFSGAGGMILGFTKAFDHSFIPIWGNDIDEAAVATYNANVGPHCITGDIVSLLHNSHVEIPQADVVIGGPPCQGFSLLNKDRTADPRRQLWRPFMEVVQRSQAQIFVMENVPQILESSELEEIVDVAKALGLTVPWEKLCGTLSSSLPAQTDHPPGSSETAKFS